MVILQEYDDNYAIDTNANIKVIYIEYLGSITLVDMTNDNVITEMGRNRILIYSILDSINGMLFKFIGSNFKITAIKFYDEFGDKVNHTLQDNKITWDNINTNWEDITTFWGDYGPNNNIGSHHNKVITKYNHPNIIGTLNTDKYPVRLYDKGRIYKGDFFITGKGLIKSGKYPTKNSVILSTSKRTTILRKGKKLKAING